MEKAHQVEYIVDDIDHWIEFFSERFGLKLELRWLAERRDTSFGVRMELVDLDYEEANGWGPQLLLVHLH